MPTWRLPAVSLLLGLFLAAQTAPKAPPFTAAQIMAKCLAARGGAAKLEGIATIYTTGHLELASGEHAPLRVWAMPERIRVEVDLAAGKLAQGYDGASAWQTAPGAGKAVVLDGDAMRGVQDQALGFPDLMAAKNQIAKIETAGTGSRDGHTYAALQFTLKNGEVFTQFLDTTTWLAFAEEYPLGAGQMGEETISDYRPVNGLLMPFRFVSGPKATPGQTSTLVRETMQLNQPIDPVMFKVPQS